MKNMLIRIVAIAVIATSISAFAGSEKPVSGKDPNTNTATSEAKAAPCAAVQQQDDQPPSCACQTEGSKEKAQNQKLIEQQDQQWLHDIQYSSGL